MARISSQANDIFRQKNKFFFVFFELNGIQLISAKQQNENSQRLFVWWVWNAINAPPTELREQLRVSQTHKNDILAIFSCIA